MMRATKDEMAPARADAIDRCNLIDSSVPHAPSPHLQEHPTQLLLPLVGRIAAAAPCCERRRETGAIASAAGARGSPIPAVLLPRRLWRLVRVIVDHSLPRLCVNAVYRAPSKVLREGARGCAGGTGINASVADEDERRGGRRTDAQTDSGDSFVASRRHTDTTLYACMLAAQPRAWHAPERSDLTWFRLLI